MPSLPYDPVLLAGIIVVVDMKKITGHL